MKTIEKIVVFLCAYLFCGWGTFFVQNANAGSAHLRVFAYDLNYTFTKDADSDVLGTYTFSFVSNVAPTGGKLIFYNHNNEVIGYSDLTPEEIAGRNASGRLSVSRTSTELAEITNRLKEKTYLDMKWGVELRGEKIIGKHGVISDLDLEHLSNYKLNQYAPKQGGTYVFNTEGAIYKQVTEPNLIFEDHTLQTPQGIAIDNNPQSPFFGRVYVANTPLENDPSNTNAGIIVYAPDPTSERGYKKIGGPYMPTGVNFADVNKRWYMHRIAVNPANGHVYYAKATGNASFSAIYELIPTSNPGQLLTDNGSAINVTKHLIPEPQVINEKGDKDEIFKTSPLHPINSLAFGPGGELYVLCNAGGESSDANLDPGPGKIYKLSKTDGDYFYDQADQYYNPEDESYVINPWTDAESNDRASAVTGSLR